MAVFVSFDENGTPRCEEVFGVSWLAVLFCTVKDPPWADAECVCDGICNWFSVTLSTPPLWPNDLGVNPDPWPCPIGDRPRMSGSAKVVRPSPP